MRASGLGGEVCSGNGNARIMQGRVIEVSKGHALHWAGGAYFLWQPVKHGGRNGVTGSRSQHQRRERRLREIEAVLHVAESGGIRVPLAEWAEVKAGFDELQQRREFVSCVRDVARLGERRNNQQ